MQNIIMSKEDYDVIVVGMGAAGVTASSTLARAGKRVLALEAQDRVGGRIRTVPFGDGLVELGAEWIHGQPNCVYDIATQHVDLKPQTLTFKVYRSNGDELDSEVMNELIRYGLGVMEEPPDVPQNVGEFTTRKLTAYIKENHPLIYKDQDLCKEFLSFLNLLVNNDEASDDWTDVSTHSSYHELEGERYMSWHTHGYRTYFDILLDKRKTGKGLPNLDIKLNTEVTNINWTLSETLVYVQCDQKTYKANHVIVTVSLGVLKETHKSLFTPQLPKDKIEAIECMSMGVIDKIELSFTEPWWPSEPKFYGFVWKGEDKAKIHRQDYWITKIYGASASMGSRNVITLWTSGEIAKLVEELPEGDVQRNSMELLKKFFSVKTLPEPTGMIRSTWYSNPYTRGSFTYDNLTTAACKHRSRLARPLTNAAGKPRVLFAGEATSERYFSTVHGASDTGFREAKRLLHGRSKI